MAKKLVRNISVTAKGAGSYVQCFQREGEPVQFDLNHFDGVRTLKDVQELRSLLDRVITTERQSRNRGKNGNEKQSGSV